MTTATTSRKFLKGFLFFLILWGLCSVSIWTGQQMVARTPAWVEKLPADLQDACDRQELLRAPSDIFAESDFSYFLPVEGNAILDPVTACPLPEWNGKIMDPQVTGEADETFSRPVQKMIRRFVHRHDSIAPEESERRLRYVRADERLVERNEALVSRTADGKMVCTPASYALLAYRKYHQLLSQQTRNMKHGIGLIIMAALLLMAFEYCLYLLRESVFLSSSKQILCGLLIGIHILIIGAGMFFFHKIGNFPSLYLFAVLPCSLVPAVASNLLGRKVGICFSLLLSTLAPMLIPNAYPFQFFLAGLFCSVAAVMAFQQIQRRTQFLKGGGLMLLLLLGLSFFLGWHHGLQWIWGSFSEFCIRLFLLSAFQVLLLLLALLLLPLILESFFDVTTVFKLNELNNRDHPLLVRLRKEARGTYEHSQNVASIASEAARAIGANDKLAEACAYFHDIGKLENPDWFGENLGEGASNPHDKISPEESCKILRRHVEYGAELARNAHLPQAICEACGMHHGNGMMNFYAKAVEAARSNGEPLPDASKFRYAAELPSRPEVVLVMMADCCEAASRSWTGTWKREEKKIERGKLSKKVEELLWEKMKEGLFAHAQLTMQEFHLAVASIVESICSMNHVRPEYKKLDGWQSSSGKAGR